MLFLLLFCVFPLGVRPKTPHGPSLYLSWGRASAPRVSDVSDVGCSNARFSNRRPACIELGNYAAHTFYSTLTRYYGTARNSVCGIATVNACMELKTGNARKPYYLMC